MIPRPSVLLVDPSEETREVLRTVLEPRGVRFLAVSRPGQAAALVRQHAPDLIVVDDETEDAGADPLEACGAAGPPAILVLGKLRRGDLPAGGASLAKPYHYGPLIRKIEELLDAVRSPLADAA